MATAADRGRPLLDDEVIRNDDDDDDDGGLPPPPPTRWRRAGKRVSTAAQVRPRYKLESDYRCAPSTGVRDSCGYLSYFVDRCALEPNLYFVNSLLRYQQKDSKVNRSPRDEAGVRALIGNSCVHPPCLFNWYMIRSTLMFTWTAWNDRNISDLTVRPGSRQLHSRRRPDSPFSCSYVYDGD